MKEPPYTFIKPQDLGYLSADGGLIEVVVGCLRASHLQHHALTSIAAAIMAAPTCSETTIIYGPTHFSLHTPGSSDPSLNEVILSRHRDLESFADSVELFENVSDIRKWCIGPWTGFEGGETLLKKKGWSGWQVQGLVHSLELVSRETSAPSRVIPLENACLDDFVATHIEAWQLDPALFGEVKDRLEVDIARGKRCFLGYVEGQPVGVSAAWCFEALGDVFAYLSGAAIAPEWRGRGLYRDMVEARLLWAKSVGATHAVTQARAATSAPRLKELGFTQCFRSSCWAIT